MKDVVLRVLRRVGLFLFIGICIAYVLILMYSLPRTVVVNITGTEVKRGIGGIGGDVRYVLAQDSSQEALIFRNEDTGWGFPPYLKFDSGTIAAKANNFAKENVSETVLVRYYGFRIPMFSAFPNVVSLKAVAGDYEHFPLFNIIFLSCNFLFFGYLGIKYVLWRRKRREANNSVQ